LGNVCGVCLPVLHGCGYGYGCGYGIQHFLKNKGTGTLG